MASRLQQIRFDDGTLGFQEISTDGALLRLYDSDGEQRARMTDADRYPCVEFEFIRDLGEFQDSDEFWDLVINSEEEPPSDPEAVRS